MPGPAGRQAQNAALPLPSPGARRGLPKYSGPLAACMPDVVPNRAFYRMQPTSILCARVHSDANPRVHRPHPPQRAKRRRKTPQSAQTHPTAIFNPSLPSPAGTAQRAARPPRSNRQRIPYKTTGGDVPHRNAAANRRAQDALCRALAHPFRDGKEK